MLDDAQTLEPQGGDYVEFVPSGTAVIGAYHCADCGYGVTLRAALPRCPMCSGTVWEAAPWSPFGRTRSVH